MVGSAQGWREATYLDLPADPDLISTHMTVVSRTGAESVNIIPGLIQRDGLPNVMRGEETQVVGVLAALPEELVFKRDVLVGLPGTHSKWVTVREGRVV